jgi:hypothetical protein
MTVLTAAIAGFLLLGLGAFTAHMAFSAAVITRGSAALRTIASLVRSITTFDERYQHPARHYVVYGQ